MLLIESLGNFKVLTNRALRALQMIAVKQPVLVTLSGKLISEITCLYMCILIIQRLYV